jgi:uncharacterized protein involved in cysteine biosynthesis
MIAALFKAFRQLSDPRLRRVVKLGVVGALLCYALLVAGMWLGLGALAERLPADQSWVGWAVAGLVVTGKLGLVVVPLLLFPALATTVSSFMLEQVADAVEARHYPELNWPRPQRWPEMLGTTLRFLAAAVVINLLALPFYLALLFTGLTLIAFYAVNGYLLGREYFEVVALRRLTPAEARLLFRNRLGKLWLAGAMITFLFSVPVLNLAAPVIATAFMVHVFQSLQRTTPKL